MQNTDYSNTETTLDVRLSEINISGTTNDTLEIRVPGDIISVSIQDFQKIEDIKIKVEKNIRYYLEDVFGIKDADLDLSTFVKSYLLSSFDNNWIEDPFWKRRYLDLSPIILKKQLD